MTSILNSLGRIAKLLPLVIAKSDVMLVGKRIIADGGTIEALGCVGSLDADFVMYPSAYKESVLYSQKPIEASGIEKITNGTFDADTDFTKGLGWVISGGNATYSGKNGTSLLDADTGAAIIGRRYLLSLDVLDNNGIGSNNVYYGNVQVSLGHLAIGSHSWVVDAIGTPSFQIWARDNETFTIDNISVKEVISNGDFTVSRAGDTATRRNKEGNIEDVLADTPILNYSEGETCPVLSLEPEKTNLLTNSIFTGAIVIGEIPPTDWIWGASTGTLDEVSTGQYAGGNKLLLTCAVDSQYLEQAAIPIGISSVNFFSVKVNVISGSTLLRDVINLSFRPVGNSQTYWLDGVLVTNTTDVPIGEHYVGIEMTNPNAGTVTLRIGAGCLSLKTVSLEIEMPQGEVSSHRSSYIPTAVGTTATRPVTEVYDAGDVNSFNSEEGVFYIEMRAFKTSQGGSRLSLISNATGAEAIFIGVGAGTNLHRLVVYQAGVPVVDEDIVATDITQFSKMAVAFEDLFMQFWIDGVMVYQTLLINNWAIGTFTVATLSSLASTVDVHGENKGFKYYNTLLTTQQLTDLTTNGNI